MNRFGIRQASASRAGISGSPSQPAVRFRRLAILGGHHRPDAQPEVSVHPGGTVHAGRDRGIERCDAAYSQQLLHSHRRRSEHDRADDRAVDHSGARDWILPAGQDDAAVGVPSAGADVRAGRRKLCLVDVQHQLLLSETHAGAGTRVKCRTGQCRRHDHADPGSAGDDFRAFRCSGRRLDDARDLFRDADRKDPGGLRDLDPERRLRLATDPRATDDHRLVRHEQHSHRARVAAHRLDRRGVRQDHRHAGDRVRHVVHRPVCDTARALRASTRRAG